MSTKKSGLGKGFESLLPQNFDKTILLNENERIVKLGFDKISAHKDQPRKAFDQTTLDELAASIKVHGILQPLIVSPIGGDKYIIVAGERRFRAAKQAGLKDVPVVIRTAKELERLEIALVENVQRVDLSVLEQANSIEKLTQQFNVSVQEIAKRLGKAPSTIGNMVKLLQLPDKAKKALNKNLISEGHARSIYALHEFPEKQEKLLNNIIKFGWSVRQAEAFVVANKKEGKDEEAVKRHMITETNETKALSKLVAAPVSIRRMAKGGKLEISFTSDDDLDRLINQLLK
jgi:ParB family chromosome partitioning protein